MLGLAEGSDEGRRMIEIDIYFIEFRVRGGVNVPEDELRKSTR